MQIVPGVHALPLGLVNAFLIEADHLVLIDTGFPGSAEKILDAVQGLGRRPEDLRHILITHCHGDHTGSLAALKEATGAAAYMHPADAALMRTGATARPMTAAPGFINGFIFRRFMKGPPRQVAQVDIEHEVRGGEELPGGMRAIHTPGHCAGHLVFLWPQHGGVLFVGDAAANILGLGLSPGYEDLAEGRHSLTRIAGLTFEAACFGHGAAIRRGASAKFRRKWPAAARR